MTDSHDRGLDGVVDTVNRISLVSYLNPKSKRIACRKPAEQIVAKLTEALVDVHLQFPFC